jgi:hypothetical protein
MTNPIARAFTFAISAAALALGAAPAQAAVEIVGAPYAPTERYGGINVQNPAFQSGGTAGRFKMTVRDIVSLQEQTFFTFCIDVAVGVQGYVAYNDVNALALIGDATKRGQLAALLTVGNPLIDGAVDDDEARDIAAALALAVWEIIYDTGASYDVLAGNFSVYGDFDPLAVRANSYLGNVTSGSWTGDASRLRGLQAVVPGSTQNQIYLAAGVPEPQVWAMLLLGFMTIGWAMRRRSAAGRAVPA